MKIAFLPIDNRPVCYQLPAMIAEVCPEVSLYIPPFEFLGDLTRGANVDGLMNWLQNLPKVDAMVLSLDTFAYGGLIPSRRSTSSTEEIKSRLECLKTIIKKQNAKVYAFSSIMRISNNNVNEEEKEYWNLYGEKIFKYSYELDKNGDAQTDVPYEIIDDYLSTRRRNFEINKLYLNWQKEGLFDRLIFSKDDCAEFGLNVKEARELEAIGGVTKTGADEIPLTLLAGAIPEPMKIAPVFLEPEEKNLISNYEDISIEKSVNGQLSLAGCSVVGFDEADLTLYINNFKKNQGEIVMKKSTEPFGQKWCFPKENYAVADVRFANGSDNNFIKEFFKTKAEENFYGYAAWNTSANTLGSLVCLIKMVRFAKTRQSFDLDAFKRVLAVRFLDDWAYQANVRQKLSCPDVEAIGRLMEAYEKQVKNFLNMEFNAKYSFPWNRLFEVKIELN